MSYAALDPQIDHWIRATGSVLFTEWAGEPARFFYVPGDGPFESFQVSISPPGSDGTVTVWARSIDTIDEQELEQSWSGAAAGLDDLLSQAMAVIEQWKRRPKASPIIA